MTSQRVITPRVARARPRRIPVARVECAFERIHSKRCEWCRSPSRRSTRAIRWRAAAPDPAATGEPLRTDACGGPPIGERRNGAPLLVHPRCPRAEARTETRWRTSSGTRWIPPPGRGHPGAYPRRGDIPPFEIGGPEPQPDRCHARRPEPAPETSRAAVASRSSRRATDAVVAVVQPRGSGVGERIEGP